MFLMKYICNRLEKNCALLSSKSAVKILDGVDK